MIQLDVRPNEVTFSVDPVERAEDLLPTCKTQFAVKALVGSAVESCSDYTADCVEGVAFHPLLAAAHLAFSQHRPLTLSPDMIWVAIVQGFAQHVKNHAERLRPLFVGHKRRFELRIERPDILKGSPENPWDDVVHELSQKVRRHFGKRYSQLVADFSTTGPAEQTACEVALLDAFRPFFEYRLFHVCGIPEITLEGTPDDWKDLREKVEAFAPYDLEWWLPSVRPICDQFVRASEGDIDLSHWRSIYKREDWICQDRVNGWLMKLVPYHQNERTGSFTIRNPLLTDPIAKFSTDVLPSGISQVPFACRWEGKREDAAMELLGGFVGITQDATTLALRPKLGWAIRPASELERLLARLPKETASPPLSEAAFDRWIDRLVFNWCGEVPGDLLLFYRKCNGVRLFGDGDNAAYRFRPLEAIELVERPKTQPLDQRYCEVVSWKPEPWVRFCDLADGTFLALELGYTYEKGWKIVRMGTEESARTGIVPIIAWSFAACLEHALASGGRLSFPPVGS